MSYTTTSQLEREARSKGDPIIWQQFFRSYVDSDANVRNKCYTILNENPEGAKQPALEKLVEKGGVWIETDIDFFHVHGVRDQIGDTTPYTLSWKKEQYTRDGTLQFTEAELLSHLYDSDEYLPSAKQFDGTLRAIQTANIHGNHASVIDLLTCLRVSIRSGMHTSTHIEPILSSIIHGWRRPNFEIIALPRGASFIAQYETRMHLLGTTDTSEQIQQRYILLSAFEPTRVEYLLDGDVHVMITGGNNNPARYYTVSDVNTRGVARLVKKTPIAKPD